ncbi:MAG: hypothetical protein H5T85_01545 [Actinobacteria bacterium]|nr:hypothetical protein [Actinomycetota bacterium]
MKFDHIGLPTTDRKKGKEIFISATKVWVTDYKKHPYRIEWLRFEPDSPVKGPVREKPHIAFKVNNLDEASKGLKVLLEPFESLPGLKVGFYEYDDGGIIELMEYKNE